jgi:hypothetical protein
MVAYSCSRGPNGELPDSATEYEPRRPQALREIFETPERPSCMPSDILFDTTPTIVCVIVNIDGSDSECR